MEVGQDNPREADKRVETADGKRVYLFRYDNPKAPNRNPNSVVSREELIGRWFTDTPESLKSKIFKRPPGGSILIIEVTKDILEELRAVNHPTAKDMDIEYDNFIVPDEFQSNTKTVPLTVPSENPRKFLFKDWRAVGAFVDIVVSELKENK